MAAKSRSQYRFMKMMEHNPEKARKQAPGLTPAKAAEFTKSNVGKKRYSQLAEYVKPKKKKKKM